MVPDLTDDEVNALDPGIRVMVRHLRCNGFWTTDSGDGVTKPEEARSFGNQPHVVMQVDHRRIVGEARRLRRLLASGWKVEASYSPDNNVALLVAIGPEAD